LAPISNDDLQATLSPICDFENVYWAFRKARSGKRSRPDVAALEFGLELEVRRLEEELAA
jgi:hypothetical protein